MFRSDEHSELLRSVQRKMQSTMDDVLHTGAVGTTVTFPLWVFTLAHQKSRVWSSSCLRCHRNESNSKLLNTGVIAITKIRNRDTSFCLTDSFFRFNFHLLKNLTLVSTQQCSPQDLKTRLHPNNVALLLSRPDVALTWILKTALYKLLFSSARSLSGLRKSLWGQVTMNETRLLYRRERLRANL